MRVYMQVRIPHVGACIWVWWLGKSVIKGGVIDYALTLSILFAIS